MPISYHPGEDLFDSECYYLVNAVNTVGAMGSGLAKAFRERLPEMYWRYWHMCAEGKLKVGRPAIDVEMTDPPTGRRIRVINFPTKDQWQNPSDVKWIIEGFGSLIYDLTFGGQMPIAAEDRSIAIPMLGCGLGGLDWAKDVRGITDTFARGLALSNYTVKIYGPEK